MVDEFINEIVGGSDDNERRLYGAVIAQVMNNIDALGEGRVQITIPSMPERSAWARVAVPTAGAGRGTWFIPQVGDQVVVIFEQGDPNSPVVIGSLWSQTDRPQTVSPTDATTRNNITTMGQLEFDMDDLKQAITIKTATQHSVQIGSDGVTVQALAGAASVKLGAAGNVTIQGATSISVKATGSLSIEAGGSVSIKGTTVSIQGAGTLTLQGGVVQIN